MKGLIRIAAVTALAFGSLSSLSVEKAEAGWGCYRPVSCYSSPCYTQSFSYAPSYGCVSSYAAPRFNCYAPAISYSSWSCPTYRYGGSFATNYSCYGGYGYSNFRTLGCYGGGSHFGGYGGGYGGYGGGCYAVPATYGSCGW